MPPAVSVPDHEPVADGGRGSGGGAVGSSFVHEGNNNSATTIAQSGRKLV
jgi:hypothetical protein